MNEPDLLILYGELFCFVKVTTGPRAGPATRVFDEKHGGFAYRMVWPAQPASSVTSRSINHFCLAIQAEERHASHCRYRS